MLKYIHTLSEACHGRPGRSGAGRSARPCCPIRWSRPTAPPPLSSPASPCPKPPSPKTSCWHCGTSCRTPRCTPPFSTPRSLRAARQTGRRISTAPRCTVIPSARPSSPNYQELQLNMNFTKFTSGETKFGNQGNRRRSNKTAAQTHKFQTW